MSTIASSNPPSTIPAYLTTTSIGKKVLMAVSGVIAFGFVCGHMLGNLQVFIGQDQMNHYAETLQNLGPMLWVIRLFLAAAFITHIWLGILLKLQNNAARPVGYKNETTQKASLASRTMIWTGLIILTFVAYHLLHYTARLTNPEYASLLDGQGRFDVYSMVIHGFSDWIISAVYIVGVGLLAYHLSHGVASMFQSLGLNSPAWQVRLNRIAWFFTILLFVGYASIPTAVLTGCLTLPGGGY